jgi:L-lactate dehydrogenase complex protein LldG
MKDNRTAFLGRVRAAVQDIRSQRLPWNELLAPADDQTILASLVNRDRKQQTALLQQLIDNAAPLNLQVHRCATLHHAAECIAALARASTPEFHPEKTLICHDHPMLRALSLDAELAEDHIPCHWTSRNNPEVRYHTLAASIGVTVADWAIAESATIVQLTRPERPRSTSLVPSIHIAVLSLANLVADLAEAYALIRREQHLDSLVLISGPSKTADIEACMVLGAHGPRAMHLVVLTESPPAVNPGFPVAISNHSCYGSGRALNSTLQVPL